MKKISRILFILIALTCLWPSSTVKAQQVSTTLASDPEIRATLAEIEPDIEKARQEKKIAGLSIAIVYDQEVLLGLYRSGFCTSAIRFTDPNSLRF